MNDGEREIVRWWCWSFWEGAKERLRKNEWWSCSICGKPSTGYGHNPQPVRISADDRCCDNCNATVVIPARLKQMRGPSGSHLRFDIGNHFTKVLVLGALLVGLCPALARAQTLGPVNPNKPQWSTNQGGGNKPCVGLMQANTPYVVVNDNRGAYSLYDWDASAQGHIDMQDNDPPTETTTTTTPPVLNKKGKVVTAGSSSTVTKTSPMTNLTIQIWGGDQTTGCDTKNGTAGCTMFGEEHYTMQAGTTQAYPWSMVQILPNGLEFEGVLVTAEVDRPATCVASDYITSEHSNP